MITSKYILSLLPEFIQKIYHKHLIRKENIWWKKQKSNNIPHTIKQKLILEYKNKYNPISIFIETGTYLGDMVWAQRNQFEQIYSIELSKKLAQKAKRRFKRKKNITIIQGNSSKIMPQLIVEIKNQAIFWLDAHYSGGITARGDKDCPVSDELKAILNSSQEHIIIINDADLFVGERDYPTISNISNYVMNQFPDSIININNNCIIIELKQNKPKEENLSESINELNYYIQN